MTQQHYTFGIIGAGQIGRRHMQALAKFERPYTLTLVDPSPTSLEEARKMMNGLPSNSNLLQPRFVADIGELDREITLLIVATNADVRFDVTRRALERSDVRYLILEKFLFPVDSEYGRMADLLASRSLKTWVNCTRRLQPFYKLVHKRFAHSMSLTQYEFSGGDWGMGSNAIHFLDHFALFGGTTEIRLDASGLDDELLPSKRKGFVELTGTLRGANDAGAQMILTSIRNSSEPPVLTLTFGATVVRVEEGAGKAVVTSGGGSTEEESFRPLYQSELTHLVAADLIERGSCDLTEFHESAILHRSLLSVMLTHINRITQQSHQTCPIT